MAKTNPQTPFDATAISNYLRTEVGIATDRAAGAAHELAESWNANDFDYQTTKDILGDYFTNTDPRPKLIADEIADTFDITLT